MRGSNEPGAAARVALRAADRGADEAALAPPSAERAVELHEREQLAELGLGEPELGSERPGVAVEDFEVARRAAAITLLGE